ncbi:MAG: hypothetical protein K9M57_02520 [Phycisphaerae bacterium]|nr:hypothetical protein [Phycisphaerae bacterium]
MNHLKNEQLIKYQFKLVSNEKYRAMDDHLAGCQACRAKLDELHGKLSPLSLLQGDPEVPESLISQTLAHVKSAPAAKSIFKFNLGWLSAAAAVLAVAGGLKIAQMMNDPGPEKPLPGTEYALNEPGNQDGPANRRNSGTEGVDQIRKDLNDSPSARISGGSANPMARALPAPGLAGIPLMKSPKNVAIEDYVPDTEPFAPASNIELVTLPRREDVQLTIYNSADLTLVRERRNLTMNTGWNWLQYMWANTLIDPTSLSLEPLAKKDKISIEQLVFPPRLRELARWLIKSQVEGTVPFEITYFTSGLSWRAFYMGTLAQDEETMTLSGYVRVTNKSGEAYENAQTRLVVGKVHLLDEIAKLARRRHAYNEDVVAMDDGKMLRLGDSNSWRFGAVFTNGDALMDSDGDDLALFDSHFAKKEITKKGLSEYFLYTIEGKETLPDGWGKRLPSFEIEDIPVKSLYKYNEDLYGATTVRFVSFSNDEEHNLGETPLPNGSIKIYRNADAENHLAYTGGTSVKYIPVNEKVELNLGTARLVKIEPKVMDFVTENYTFDKHKNISGWDEVRTWTITIDNTRRLPIDIEITRGFGSPYWDLALVDGEVAAKKHDSTHERFTLSVGPETKRAFTYKVRTYTGQRIEAYSK